LERDKESGNDEEGEEEEEEEEEEREDEHCVRSPFGGIISTHR